MLCCHLKIWPRINRRRHVQRSVARPIFGFGHLKSKFIPANRQQSFMGRSTEECRNSSQQNWCSSADLQRSASPGKTYETAI